MKKSLIIKIGIAILVCFIAIGIYTVMTNKEEVAVIPMEVAESTLPQVYFEEEGQIVNTLMAYRGDMEITSMRDTITPLDANGKLVCYIDPNESNILSISYEVYSIDGMTCLVNEDLEEWSAGTAIELNLKDAAILSEECILKITMILEQTPIEESKDSEEVQYAEEVTFYTRTLSYNELNLKSNITVVDTVHTAILAKDEATVEDYFSLTNSNAGSLQDVDLTSSVEDMMWGELEPIVVGDVSWSIEECNSNSTAFTLTYQVEIEDPDRAGIMELYNIEEYMRVGYSSSSQSTVIIEYNRTTNQVLDEENLELYSKGIVLGISDDVDEWEISEDGTVIAFVQERELWVYDKEENVISCLFTFASQVGSGINWNQHDIRVYNVDEEGNVAFSVYGYQNCGDHEGQVGIAVYYYNKLQNSIEEVAYIPSNQSYEIGKETMMKQVYFQGENQLLYVISGTSFYQVDLELGGQTILSDEMELGRYFIAEDETTIIYQSGTEDAPELTVLEMSSGDTVVAKGTSGITMVPLGIFNNDLVYGYADSMDELPMELGDTLIPMYALFIQEEDGTNAKTYMEEDVFIESVTISSTRIVLNQVVVQDGIYVSNGEDYITNNEAVPSASVSTETFSGNEKQTEKRLSFTSDITEMKAETMHPVMSENPDAIQVNCEAIETEEMYHVYMYGKLALNTADVSEAIQLASDNYGVVTNDNQKYVWMRGNRSLTYSLTNISELKAQLQSGTSALQIILDATQGSVSNYTGCTTEEMCYIINQGQPIAVKFKDGTWNLLVSYTSSTMTYLNASGSSVTDSMTDLDSLIVEMVGS